ncbi:MAG: hypothetical protein AMS22_12870 [Thiotrichales bacterium SG8_50]|nr:MAG: hypothetical protein AMS22_12870 [Thiotrichales bacterium SG8_50]
MICEQCDSYQNEVSLLNDELFYAQSERDTLEIERDDARDRVKELTETLQECARLAGLLAKHDRNGITLRLLDQTSEFANE